MGAMTWAILGAAPIGWLHLLTFMPMVIAAALPRNKSCNKPAMNTRAF